MHANPTGQTVSISYTVHMLQAMSPIYCSCGLLFVWSGASVAA